MNTFLFVEHDKPWTMPGYKSGNHGGHRGNDRCSLQNIHDLEGILSSWPASDYHFAPYRACSHLMYPTANCFGDCLRDRRPNDTPLYPQGKVPQKPLVPVDALESVFSDCLDATPPTGTRRAGSELAQVRDQSISPEHHLIEPSSGLRIGHVRRRTPHSVPPNQPQGAMS